MVQRQRYLQWQQRQREEREKQPKPVRRDLNFFRQNYLRSIVLIQACCRRWLAMRAYHSSKRGDMPLPTLRRFLHLLDIGQVL